MLPYSYLLKNFFNNFFHLLMSLSLGSSNFFSFLVASGVAGLSFYVLFIRRLKN